VFVGAVLSQGMVFAAIFSYLAGSTFVLQDIYGLTPQWYAAAFALNSAGGVLAGRLGGRTGEHWRARSALFLGVRTTALCPTGLLLFRFVVLHLAVAGAAPLPLVFWSAFT